MQQQDYVADFMQPTAVIIDNNNHVWVLDGLQQRVVVFNQRAEKIDTIHFKLPQNDRLSDPMAMLLIGDSILLADSGKHRLARFSLTGELLDILDLTKLVDADKASPEPVALWFQDDLLYWSDRANHEVCQLQWNKRKLLRCFGGKGDAEKQFRFPFQLAADRDGYIYSVDVLNGRVQVYNTQGQYFSRIGRFGLRPGELFRPNGLAVDNKDFVFVSDSYLGVISIYQSGRFLAYLGDRDNVRLAFASPVSLTLKNNALWVVDSLENKVTKLSLSYRVNDEPQNTSKSRQLLNHSTSSRKNCVRCHISWADETKAIGLPPSKQVLAVASEKMCYSCHHGVVVDSRRAMMQPHQHPTIYRQTNSSELSPEQSSAERQDKLPEIFPLSKDKQLFCSSCHTPHNSDEIQDVLYRGHSNSWMRVTNNDGNLCEQCHESKALDARKPKKQGVNHPLAIKFSPPDKHNAKAYVHEKHLQQGLPKRLQHNGGVLGKQKQLICQSCHQIHAGKSDALLTAENVDSQLCVSCHKSKQVNGKKKSHKQGIHPVNIKLEKALEYKGEMIKKVECSRCHSVHAGKPGSPLMANEEKQDVETLCQACHQGYSENTVEEALKKGLHPVNVKLDKPVDIADKKVRKIKCLTCHSMHNGQKNTAALVQTDNNGELCSNCHEAQQAIFNTDHDLRVTAKDSHNRYGQLPNQAGLCGSCHSMHKGRNATAKVAYLSSVKTVQAGHSNTKKIDPVLLKRDQLCINCHQDNGVAKEKVVTRFSHPYENLILRSDSKQMPLLVLPDNSLSDKPTTEKIAEFGAIGCITCHNPHRWKPGDATSKIILGKESNTGNIEGDSSNSFLRQKDIAGTFCVSCHGIEARIKYKYYHFAP